MVLGGVPGRPQLRAQARAPDCRPARPSARQSAARATQQRARPRGPEPTASASGARKLRPQLRAAAPQSPLPRNSLTTPPLPAPSPLPLAAPQGLCTVTNRVLPANETSAAAASAAAMSFSFKCSPSDFKASAKIEGPALNVWAGLSSDAKAGAGAASTCAITTLNPVLYFHHQANPLFHYGYSVAGLPCKQVAAGDAAVPSADDLTSQVRTPPGTPAITPASAPALGLRSG